MTALNDAFRFLLELCLLGAVGVWGARKGGSTAGSVLLAVAAPAIVAVFWGVLLAPRSPNRLTDPLRLVAELAAFGSGVWALAAIGKPKLAAAFAAAALLNIAAQFLLGRGEQASP